MSRKIVNRLTGKFVIWLVLFGGVLTLLGTLTHLYLDYRLDIKTLKASLEYAASTQLYQLSRSVEVGDAVSVYAALENLLIHDYLNYAAVIVGDKVTWQRGKKPDGRFVSAILPFDSGTVGGGLSEHGSLEVIADMQPFWQQLRNRFIQMLLGNILEIFLFAGFVLFMIHYLVTRNLEFLGAQIRQLDVPAPCSPQQITRKTKNTYDELDELVAGLNTMSRRFHDTYEILAESERQFKLFLDSIEEAVICVDRSGICTFANTAAPHLLGLNTAGDGQIVGKSFRELIIHSIGQDGETVTENCLVDQSMKEGRALKCEEGNLRVNAGRVLPAALRCYPLCEEDRVSGAIVFITDNRENRQLRREWKLLSEAVKQVPVMIIITDNENRIEFVNAGVERQTGYARKDLLGRSIFSFRNLITGGDVKFSRINTALQNGRQWEGEIEIRSKWGSSVQLYAIISNILNEEGSVVNVISVCREISYELALQNDLVNAKKMEAVGRLSAKFAHEFGNPLFGVRSVLKDFCNRTEFSTEDSRLLYLAHHECERMRVMVREFQQLYQNSASGEELETLADIVDKVLSEFRHLMASSQVSCVVDLTSANGSLIRNNNKLFLVLRNVIINAIEAMEETGGQLAIVDRIEGRKLVVAVCDQGKGIKAEHQELIFEPFFSTKPEVEGAGLGLSVAYGTMKSMGGSITFTSKEGEGAMFQVHIPLR